MSKLEINFTDKEWGSEFKTAFGLSVTVYKYTFGTIDGIYTKTEDGVDIISINNSTPHNGQFKLFLEALERYKKETGKRVAICAFMNKDLYWHIRKRPGWGNCLSTMDRLEYYGE